MRIWYYLSPNVSLVKSGNKYLLILYYSVSNKRKSIVLFIFTGLFNTTEIIKRIDDDIDWDDEDNCSVLIEEFNISYIIL